MEVSGQLHALATLTPLPPPNEPRCNERPLNRILVRKFPLLTIVHTYFKLALSYMQPATQADVT
jgi:hypothetical protein